MISVLNVSRGYFSAPLFLLKNNVIAHFLTEKNLSDVVFLFLSWRKAKILLFPLHFIVSQNKVAVWMNAC